MSSWSWRGESFNSSLSGGRDRSTVHGQGDSTLHGRGGGGSTAHSMAGRVGEQFMVWRFKTSWSTVHGLTGRGESTVHGPGRGSTVHGPRGVNSSRFLWQVNTICQGVSSGTRWTDPSFPKHGPPDPPPPTVRTEGQT